jgi:hypothetical protein
MKVTVFSCPHCRGNIPNGLERSDQGLVVCPGCSRPVKITSSEYEDAKQKKVYPVCWAIAAVALFVIITWASYADNDDFGRSIMMGVIGSAIATYITGGLLAAAIIKLFPREFK